MKEVLRTGIALLLLGAALPGGARGVEAQGASRVINGVEVSGRFLEVWSGQGGEQRSVYVNGLPVSARRVEVSLEDGKPYEVQWFERARYELHPENPRPNDVLLGRLGAWDAEGRGKIDPATGRAASPADVPFTRIPQPPGADGLTKLWFAETGHSLAGKFLEYWRQYGGLAQFGYPLSEPFEETSRADGKRYTVQYFERNRMELHPEKPAPYEVELGLLGVEQRGIRAVPADELPLAPPKSVTSAKETIRVASSQEPRALTFSDNSSVARRVRSLIEDGLTGRDDNENLFPLNAWYVPTLENGGARFVGEGEDRYLQVKYKLRRGIKWSDGRELTSNDAAFAYRLMLHPNAPVPDRSEYLRLHGMDNPDRHTIIYNYRSYNQARAFYNGIPDKENYAYLRAFIDAKRPVTSRLYSEIGSIQPEHELGKLAPEAIKDSAYERAPIGTGPWKVQRWTTGQEIVLVQNEHYSLTEKPPLKWIEIKFVTDAQFLDAHFKTGNMDIITSEAYFIPPADKAGIEAAGGRIVSRPSATWEHLDFFMDYAPFKERRVREAIITAINRQRVIDVAFRGGAGMMHGVVPANVPFSLEHPDFSLSYPDIAARFKLPVYSYNPARAVQLLEEAGWLCPPNTSGAHCSGQSREKGGMKLQFEYGTTINALRQQTQILVVADLKAVGVDAQQKAYPASVFFSAPGPRYDGTTKLAQLAWVTTESSDFSVWYCPEIYGTGTYHPSTNCTQRYYNPNVEALNNKFNTSSGTEMVEAAAEAQVILMQDLPTIPLARRANIEVVNGKLQNHKLPNGLTSSFWNARQWWFVR